MKLLQVGSYESVRSACIDAGDEKVKAQYDAAETQLGYSALTGALHPMPRNRQDIVDSEVNHIVIVGEQQVAKITGSTDQLDMVLVKRIVYRYNGNLYAEAV